MRKTGRATPYKYNSHLMPYPESETAHRKVKKVMHEFKEGTLRSSSGAKVTSRKQAIRIGLEEARKAERKKRKRN